MTTFCLEIRSTADWTDCRYREYTTSARRAEAFGNIPKIRYTDSNHGLVPAVRIQHGKRHPPIRTLADHVREHLVEAPKPERINWKARAAAAERGLAEATRELSLVESIIAERLAHYETLIDNGKGTHGQPDYVTDATWYGWGGRLSVYRALSSSRKGI